MANNSDNVSDARSPMTEEARLATRVTALEESNVVLTFQYLRAKSKRRRLKKSFNRLAGRYVRLKEKYATVLAERNRLAGENNWASKPLHMYPSLIIMKYRFSRKAVYIYCLD